MFEFHLGGKLDIVGRVESVYFDGKTTGIKDESRVLLGAMLEIAIGAVVQVILACCAV